MRISDWSSDVCSSDLGAEEPPRVSAPPAGATPIAMITAIDRARRLFPQAAFSGVQFPAADAPYYAVQLRQPGEAGRAYGTTLVRSEEHTSELQSLMRTSYAVFCLKKKQQPNRNTNTAPRITYTVQNLPQPSY